MDPPLVESTLLDVTPLSRMLEATIRCFMQIRSACGDERLDFIGTELWDLQSTVKDVHFVLQHQVILSQEAPGIVGMIAGPANTCLLYVSELLHVLDAMHSSDSVTSAIRHNELSTIDAKYSNLIARLGAKRDELRLVLGQRSIINIRQSMKETIRAERTSQGAVPANESKNNGSYEKTTKLEIEYDFLEDLQNVPTIASESRRRPSQARQHSFQGTYNPPVAPLQPPTTCYTDYLRSHSEETIFQEDSIFIRCPHWLKGKGRRCAHRYAFRKDMRAHLMSHYKDQDESMITSMLDSMKGLSANADEFHRAQKRRTASKPDNVAVLTRGEQPQEVTDENAPGHEVKFERKENSINTKVITEQPSNQPRVQPDAVILADHPTEALLIEVDSASTLDDELLDIFNERGIISSVSFVGGYRNRKVTLIEYSTVECAVRAKKNIATTITPSANCDLSVKFIQSIPWSKIGETPTGKNHGKFPGRFVSSRAGTSGWSQLFVERSLLQNTNSLEPCAGSTESQAASDVYNLSSSSNKLNHEIATQDQNAPSSLDWLHTKRAPPPSFGLFPFEFNSRQDVNFDDDQVQYDVPDECMHGIAVALYSFEIENDNELSLEAGQQIWIERRQSNGWLLATCYKTQRCGLVPEMFIRLLTEDEVAGPPELKAATRISKTDSMLVDPSTKPKGDNEKFNNDEESSAISRSSSLASIADSLFSILSGSSASSAVGPLEAVDRLVRFFEDDSVIRLLCIDALATIAPDRFERNLRRLLKQFAVSLRGEAVTTEQRRAAHFVRFRSRNAAHIMCSTLKKQDVPKVGHTLPDRQVPAAAMFELVVEGEDTPDNSSESSDSEEEVDSLQELEAFILTSEAIVMLRANLRAFIYPSTVLKPAALIESKQLNGDISKLPANSCEDAGQKKSSAFKPRDWLISQWVQLAHTEFLVTGSQYLKTKLPRYVPPVAPDKTRLEWTCKCGHKIVDDFNELQPGGVERLRRELTTERANENSNPMTVPTFVGLIRTCFRLYREICKDVIRILKVPTPSIMVILAPILYGVVILCSFTSGEFTIPTQILMVAIIVMSILNWISVIVGLATMIFAGTFYILTNGPMREYVRRSWAASILNVSKATLKKPGEQSSSTLAPIKDEQKIERSWNRKTRPSVPVSVASLEPLPRLEVNKVYRYTPEPALRAPASPPRSVQPYDNEGSISVKSSSSSFIDAISESLASLKSSFNFGSKEEDSERGLPRHSLSSTSSTAQTTGPVLQPSELLYLLLCYPSGRYATRLLQLDLVSLQANCDRSLFTILRSNYQGMRGSWKRHLSLRCLESIKFVHFEMYQSELIDVRKQDDIPPPGHIDYRYAPAPLEVVPPVGDRHMMHLFNNPTCAESHPILLTRFPKKLRQKLLCTSPAGVNPGWGLQFIENWDVKKISILVFVLFGTASLSFAILWAVFMHSVQDAFAIAAYMIALAMISVGTLQAVLVL